MAEESEHDRRGFLKLATWAMGGAIGAVVSLPVIRYLFHPVGRETVSAPEEPVDVAAAADLVPGAAPVKLPVVASEVRDAWTVTRDVAIGSVWLSRTSEGEIRCFTSVCPHLGCAVDFDEDEDLYRCPCHRSAFALDGARISGPSKRGLDPLQVSVEHGRIEVVYQRFRPDIPEREPV